MRQIAKEISLKIDGQDLSFRLTKPDAFSGAAHKAVPVQAALCLAGSIESIVITVNVQV